MKIIFLMIALFFVSCNSPEKLNDFDSDFSNSDSDNEETTDFTEEEESCSNDEEYDSWDFVLDLGRVDHVSRIIPYKNGYLLSGVIDFPYKPNDNLYVPGYVAFMNHDYSIQWSRLIDKTVIGGMDYSDDNTIFISGHIGNETMFLGAIDENGEMLWQKKWKSKFFYKSGLQSANAIKVLNDAIFILGNVSGWNEDGSAIFNDIYLSKANLNGEIIWEKVFGTEGFENAWELEFDEEGGIYITGYSTGNFEGNNNANKPGDCGDERYACSDVIFMKTDIDGNVIWTKQWGSDSFTNLENGRKILIDNDEIYVLSRVKLYGGTKIVIRKYSKNGNLIWEKSAFEDERGVNYKSSNMILDKSGNIIVSGYISYGDFSYGDFSYSDIFVAALKKINGEIISVNRIVSNKMIEMYGLQETEKGFLLMGQESVYSELSEKSYSDTFFKEIGYFYNDPKPDATTTKGDESVRETVRIGSEKDDEIVFSNVDSEGNIFVAGNTWGSIGGSENKGKKDVFAAKYKSDGTLEWSKNYGSTDWDSAVAVATDNDGNFIISGSTWGDFEGNERLGVGDIFVMKIDKTGKLLWAETAGSDNDDWVNGIWTDKNGNIFLTGGTLGSIDDNVFSDGFGGGDMFAGKWDKNGNKIIINQWGQRIEGFGISGDNKGNIYVSGKVYRDYMDEEVKGMPDSIIFKLDENLEEQWARIWGSVEVDSATDIAVDSVGDIFVTGYTFGAIDGNLHLGENCPGGYCPDAYLTKWDSTGKKKWTRQFGTEFGDRATTIAIDENDGIYVSGTAGKNRLCEIENDIFLIKSDTSGNLEEIKVWGTAGEEKVNDINISNGNIIISGFTTGGLDDNDNLGGIDGFVMVIEKY